MENDVVLTTLIIFVARVADVSLGTLRQMAIVSRWHRAAWLFTFVERLIWIIVVAQVVTNLREWSYIIAYAAGAASGTIVGMYIENVISYGERVVRVFSRKGEVLANRLRDKSYIVSVFPGQGRDGPIDLLLVEVKRRRVRDVINLSKEVDPQCFYFADTSNVSSRKG